MELDLEADRKKLEFYKGKVGLFANIEYKISRNQIIRAVGKFSEIDSKGLILIQHLKVPEKSWRFHFSKIISEYFERINGGFNEK